MVVEIPLLPSFVSLPVQQPLSLFSVSRDVLKKIPIAHPHQVDPKVLCFLTAGVHMKLMSFRGCDDKGVEDGANVVHDKGYCRFRKKRTLVEFLVKGSCLSPLLKCHTKSNPSSLLYVQSKNITVIKDSPSSHFFIQMPTQPIDVNVRWQVG